MQIELKTILNIGDIHNNGRIDLLAIPYITGKGLVSTDLFSQLNLDKKELQEIIDANILKERERPLIIYYGGNSRVSRLLLLPFCEDGLEKFEDGADKTIFKLPEIEQLPIKNCTLSIDQCLHLGAKSIANMINAFACAIDDKQDFSYSFKSSDKNKPFLGLLNGIQVVGSSDDFSESELAAEISYLNSLMEGKDLCRTVANTPSNICTPQYLAEKSLALAKEFQTITVKIYEKDELEKLGMNGLLAVGAGSSNPPLMIEISYSPESLQSDDTPCKLFVGKAVTFDSGGISIKPSSNMHHMKFDMCGGATLIGMMKSIAISRHQGRVVSLIAACENMPDGSSYRPGDVLEMYNGLTVEILNTDAEGRVALGDALAYGSANHKPEMIIDLATLTGACSVALGSVNSGLFTNDDNLASELIDAGKRSGDRTWRLPLETEYKACIETHVADVANAGSGRGGAITAAMFLEKFVGDCKWAHIDIAGVAYTSGSSPKATGRPLAMLLEFLRESCHKSSSL